MHGKVHTGSFRSVKEALDWIQKQWNAGRFHDGQEFSGHHSGEGECSQGCDDRMVDDWLQLPSMDLASKCARRSKRWTDAYQKELYKKLRNEELFTTEDKE